MNNLINKDSQHTEIHQTKIEGETIGLKAKTPQFSLFNPPITNLIPCRDIGFCEVYKMITSDFYETSTADTNHKFLEYLETQNKKPYSHIKTSRFGYCTFSGTFSQRADNDLIHHSGLYCMDSDNVVHARALMDKITKMNDPYFEVELCFKSMSGFGVKWVISLRNSQVDQDHTTIYKGLQGYIKKTYGIETDNTTDVSRACFLSYDPKAYINPKYLF